MSSWWFCEVIYIVDLFAHEPIFPMVIRPTKFTNVKGRRGINRLLPKGNRYRGDVGVYQ